LGLEIEETAIQGNVMENDQGGKVKSSRFFTLILMLACALVPASGHEASPPLVPKFLAGGRTPAIPFDLFDTIIYVPVKVNNRGPYSFILDTGNGGPPILNENLTRLLQIPLGLKQSIQGAGAKQVDLYRIDKLNLSLSGLEFADVPSATLPLHLMDPHWGKRKDGLIGGSLLSVMITEIDYQNKTVRFHAPGAYDGPGGDVIPIEVFGQPYARMKIFLWGVDRPVDALMMIDTGVRLTTFNAPYSKQNRLADQSPKSLATMTGYGIGGESRGAVGRVRAIQIGSSRIENPVVGFSTDTSGALSGDQFSGIIGADILSRFQVVFDYPGGKMILRKNDRFDDRFEYDMSGLRLMAEGEKFDRIRIFHVADDTPAQAAGLFAGDEIKTVDGRSAAEIGWEGLRRIFRQDGRAVKLEIGRGGKILPVILKLRRLV
jgi:hypothetical protein